MLSLLAKSNFRAAQKIKLCRQRPIGQSAMIITGVLIPGDFGHGGLTVKYKNDYVLKKCY
jgi:hypothetical protein